MQDITFIREDWRLFYNLATLGQKAGVPRSLLGGLVVKELVDNALDAGAKVDCGNLDSGGIWVEDNGQGIDPAKIATLFSVNRPLTSTKLLRRPLRGALGNGLRVVVGAVYASGGKLRVRTRGQWMTVEPQPDGRSIASLYGDPELEGAAMGLRVEIELGPDCGINLSTSMERLSLTMNSGPQFKGKSSAHWYDAGAFRELFHAAGAVEVNALVALMDGSERSYSMGFGPVKCSEMSHAQINEIHRILTKENPPILAKHMGSIGRQNGPYDGYAKVLTSFRSSDNVPVNLPCVIEVWAEKTKEDEPTVQFMVNRTLVPAQVKAWVDRKAGKMAISGCGLSHYMATGRTVCRFLCNIITPYMPVTNDGKDPDLLPLLDDLSSAFKKAAASAKRAAGSDGEVKVSKRDLIERCLDQAIAKASGHGKYRYSLRQLFYSVRPRIMDRDQELEYGYFCSVITAIESDRGRDLPGMYRDARGHLYHPHTGESIALGTLNVEKYQQPEYLFNKVLYIEKGGFFPLLIEQKWPERHDCALLTSQGFASRAARDVIDLLGDSAEELTFYAIHDADGPGTAIIEALQEATKARPGRRVKIVNLGLEPSEGLSMGLEVEAVDFKSKKVPVGSYVSPRWREWLQTQRIELNAMDSETFIGWLDRKMNQATSDFQTPQKLIPPAAVVEAAIDDKRRQVAREQAIAKVLATCDLEKLIAQELKDGWRTPSPDAVRAELIRVQERGKAVSWRDVSDRLAAESMDAKAKGE